MGMAYLLFCTRNVWFLLPRSLLTNIVGSHTFRSLMQGYAVWQKSEKNKLAKVENY